MKNFCVCLCSVFAFLGAISFFSPTGRMKKSAELIFSLTFTLFLINSFTLFNGNDVFSLPTQESEMSSTASAFVAEKTAELILKSEGINFEKVEINATTSEDGNISIKSITVYSPSDKERAREILLSKTVSENVEIK